MTKRPMRACPGCGARTPSAERRCRICTRVINHRVREPDRGLAALHPDVGFGPTFSAAWDPRTAGSEPDIPAAAVQEPGATSGAAETGVAADEIPKPASASVSLPPAPGWTSVPIELSEPLWEPTRDGFDDASVDLAATIVLDAPLRNGATPPPLVYETEHFDPAALELDLGLWAPRVEGDGGEHDIAV